MWLPSRLFTQAAPRPIQSVSCDVRLYVCPLLETQLYSGLETLIFAYYMTFLGPQTLHTVSLILYLTLGPTGLGIKS